jgi:hypothetical protein
MPRKAARHEEGGANRVVRVSKEAAATIQKWQKQSGKSNSTVIDELIRHYTRALWLPYF